MIKFKDKELELKRQRKCVVFFKLMGKVHFYLSTFQLIYFQSFRSSKI